MSNNAFELAYDFMTKSQIVNQKLLNSEFNHSKLTDMDALSNGLWFDNHDKNDKNKNHIIYIPSIGASIHKTLNDNGVKCIDEISDSLLKEIHLHYSSIFSIVQSPYSKPFNIEKPFERYLSSWITLNIKPIVSTYIIAQLKKPEETTKRGLLSFIFRQIKDISYQAFPFEYEEDGENTFIFENGKVKLKVKHNIEEGRGDYIGSFKLSPKNSSEREIKLEKENLDKQNENIREAIKEIEAIKGKIAEEINKKALNQTINSLRELLEKTFRNMLWLECEHSSEDWKLKKRSTYIDIFESGVSPAKKSTLVILLGITGTLALSNPIVLAISSIVALSAAAIGISKSLHQIKEDKNNDKRINELMLHWIPNERIITESRIKEFNKKNKLTCENSIPERLYCPEVENSYIELEKQIFDKYDTVPFLPNHFDCW